VEGEEIEQLKKELEIVIHLPHPFIYDSNKLIEKLNKGTSILDCINKDSCCLLCSKPLDHVVHKK
jgi:hypothetical protein